MLVLIAAILSNMATLGQTITQRVNGKVLDNFTDAPIPGANIVLLQGDKQFGTFTNNEGWYSIKDVHIGKYKVTVSCIGYHTHVENNVYIQSGKNLNLEIRLSPAIEELTQVNVVAKEHKHEPLNKMSMIGARSFNLDETNRYAGSYGDPARMAMNYAGILPVRDNRNDIIIRGNSAVSLQWRIEGIEIPNPNHFGASGTTGGPITIINTNLLAKSDFFNGTFPAEYGNAIAGVFDLKLKPANSQNHERWFQIGWNGLELGIEGPLSKNKKSTYMISYRHGIPDVLYHMGINQKERVMYKDLSFKFNFPGTKTGNWELIGMGGNSRIIIDELNLDENERTFKTYGENLDNYTSMGMIGLINRVYPSKKMKITNSLSTTGNTVKNVIDTFTIVEENPFLWAKEQTEEIKFSAGTKINYRINNRQSITTGISYDHFLLSYNDMEWQNNKYINYTDTANAQQKMLKAHLSLRQLLGTRFEFSFGLYSQYFFFNNSYSFEPRTGFKFQATEKINIAYGLGLHSITQPKMVYFVQTFDQYNNPYLTNSNLDFSKSLQQSLAFNHILNERLNLKIEAYYQYLYNVPVQTSQPEYSLINFGTEYYIERKDSLVNSGKGQNCGIEFTLERFLHRNFFYLFTASLFESNYTGTDNTIRNTAYNGQYAFNALAGYELYFSKKNVGLILGLNLTYAGGSPYVPFDKKETVNKGRAMYDWDRAYAVKRDDYKRISLRIGIKRNMKKASMETTLDLQYRSDYTDIYMQRIDVTTGEIIDTNDLGFYPMINMKISF